MEPEFDLHSYDKYIVSFSGGKDSTATFFICSIMVYQKTKSNSGIRKLMLGKQPSSIGRLPRIIVENLRKHQSENIFPMEGKRILL